MRTWVLIDATYICHRAYHSTGNLSFEDEPTGVIYGFLRDCNSLRTRFATERLVFCWDHGPGIREKKFPFYKETRRKDSSDENVKKQEIMRPQIEKLKNVYLPQIGYKNNFMQTGYEADDIIGKVIYTNFNEWKFDHEFVIVTGDKDMYQLILEDTVRVYHPREDKIVNEKSFRKEYGISPMLWPAVKALAGCSSDEIPGMVGVGEKTACKFYRKLIRKTEKRYKEIEKFTKSKQMLQNFQLVRLPLKGVKEFDLRDDERNEKAYRDLLSQCGIQTLG